METIFKVSDTVYHWKYGEGEVIRIFTSDNSVLTEFGEQQIVFDQFGAESKEPPTLSFKPYDLVKGGFSQQRPLKVDTLVYVRDEVDDEWQMQFFSHFNQITGKIHTFDSQVKSTYHKKNIITTQWNEYRLTNPLLEE